MKVLVVGSGGREHCLAYKIKQSPRVKEIFVAPGNGGTARHFKNIDIKAEDIEGLINFARKNMIDLTVVGPELPLSLGIKDVFEKHGLSLFGPNMFCSRLESSKSFAKEIMSLQNIPNPGYEVFDHEQLREAVDYIRIKNRNYPLVVKADGLAAGKGVVICRSQEEAESAVYENLKDLKHGKSSKRIIIEEYIEGNEVSFMCIIDGKNILPLETSEDYKKAFDYDQGPNTGGMGAYSPSIHISEELKKSIIDNIFSPVIEGISITGETYTGVLYAGLIIKNSNIYVLEFNVRFGDPETQAILIKLESDIIDIFEKTLTKSLDSCVPQWNNKQSLTVVLASEGYPGSYKNGVPILGIDSQLPYGTEIFHSGTVYRDNSFYTSGGRVCSISSFADSIKECRERVYTVAESINFDGMFYRKDIGLKAAK